MLFLVTALCHGYSKNDKNEMPPEIMEISLKGEDYGCSVTTSGTVEVGDNISIEMTITVEGPCDARLAQMVRDRIAEIRASAKK
tara:strand:+ start:1406 stop:1657 length:252 start_codon:yes stop_codon:yes gene_type:complete